MERNILQPLWVNASGLMMGAGGQGKEERKLPR